MQLLFDHDTNEYLRKMNSEGRNLITDVHPDDEMYLWFTTHPAHMKAPLKQYFASGDGMLNDLRQMLNQIDRPLEQIGRFLEFASGYGRFTRHLLRCIDPSAVTVSDVYKNAVDFQKATFHVDGFYSEFDPCKVVIPNKYDVIFVASLFSHLPEHTWRPWLRKLFNSLAENGVLIFSVHGVTCMPDPSKMTDSGFHFVRMSESRSHSYDDYGTTYVTSDFVRQAIETETHGHLLHEIPKGLWSYQDVYVVENKTQ